MKSLRRLLAVILKECTQIERDPSILLIGLFLPIFLLMLFGYGLSMDVKGVPVAIVAEDASPLSDRFTDRFLASDYFSARKVTSRLEAEALLENREVDAVLHIPSDFARRVLAGEADLGLTIHGVDANQATMIRTYVSATIATQLATNAELAASVSQSASAKPSVALSTRAWFNEANKSAWYLVPGLTIVVMTLTCSFMGSIVIAREWERGTMESLCTTRATPLEILSAKLCVNYGFSTLGLLLCLALARLVFEVPVRGDFGYLIATLLIYNLWAMSFGLFLSAATKRQFVAIQMAVIGSYLPALILSGYLFDLRSVPDWIAWVGHLMPPTYAIESVKILCLSGGSDDIVRSNAAFLAAWSTLFFGLALNLTRKRLD